MIKTTHKTEFKTKKSSSITGNPNTKGNNGNNNIDSNTNNKDHVLIDNFFNAELPDLKSFDLYQHMKINVKEFEKNCHDEVDHIDTFSYYCITCKVSVCNLCNYHTHKTHFLLNKIHFDLDNSSVERVFTQMEEDIEKKELVASTSNIKNELKEIITEEFNLLHEKLESIKESKIKEINSLFSNIGNNENYLVNIKSRVNEVKSNISGFFEKNKKFLNYEKFNNDYENTIFLVVFEMLNLCVQKNKEIKAVMNKIEEDSENYKNSIRQKTSTLMKLLDDFNKPEDNKDTLQPKNALMANFEKLNADFYKEVRIRTQKYNEHMENFRTLAFETINKTGSIREIEKIINLFDKKNEKGIAYIFNQEGLKENEESKNHEYYTNANSNNNNTNSPLKVKLMQNKSGKKGGVNINTTNTNNFPTLNPESEIIETNPNQTTQTAVFANKVFNYKNKNDIRLDNPIIRRYFAYSTLDCVNKNFRIKTNAGGTSSAYLLVKPDFDMEEGNDVCKPIIGTNEIHIYDRKKRVLLKKKVNLDKHLHGFTHFLDGTRHILVNDKLFITGGRDENQEFNTVLTYDIKEFHLKRVPDMKVAHSYHAIEYIEMFKSLLVIGGQSNKSCELYDLFTNRWRVLPELNFPRANPLIYFDKNENHIYTLFGLKGDITQLDSYSEAIEVLELQEMSKGWTNIEYENKSDLDFKVNFCQIYPLTNDKILIYGANSSRNINKSFAVYCMDKCEIIKVDKKLLEELRLQARKSSKLSKILSTMSK